MEDTQKNLDDLSEVVEAALELLDQTDDKSVIPSPLELEEDEFTPGGPASPAVEPEYDEEPLPVSESKEFKQLRARIKSKSENVDLQEDMVHLSVRKGMNFSNHGKRTAEDYRPTPDELKEINQISNIDLTKNDLYSIPIEAADDLVDRQGEAFNDPARTKLAVLSYNKAFLTDHSWDTAHHLGTIYSAKNEDGLLKQKIFILDIPENQKYIKNMLGGVYNKISIGFSANLKDMRCMSCDNGTSIYDSACQHMPGAPDEKGVKTFVLITDVADYFESSLVPIPAQKNAGIRRRSLTVTPEMQQAWEKSTEQKMVPTVESNSSEPIPVIYKKVDTINSDNTTLGDELVPDTTTENSTADESLAKTADVFTSEGAVPDAIEAAIEASTEVDAEKGGCAMPEEEDEKDKARTLGEVAGDCQMQDGNGMDGADCKPEPKAPSAKKEMSKAAKKLTKALEEFKATVQELKEVAAALKGSGTDVSALAESQKSLGTKLEALTKFVETATAVTFENLEREAAVKKQIGNAQTSTSGNQWAVDLTKGILGGK